MFEKNMSCEMRVMYGVISLIFLLTLLFGKFFAIVGLLFTGFVAATGECLGKKILGPIICEESAIDTLHNLGDKVKSAADEAFDKAKGVADDVVDTVKDKISKKD